MDNQTYYDILGVKKDASLENIRYARNRLKFGEDSVPFWMWEKIDKAYDVLSDSEKRKEYDKNIEVDSYGQPFFKDSSIDEIPNDLGSDYFEQIETSSVKNSQEEPNKSPENIQVNDNFGDDFNDNEQTKNSNSSQDDEPNKEQKLEEISELKNQTQNHSISNELPEKLRFKLNEDAKFKDANSVMSSRKRNRIIKYAVIGGLVFVLNVGGIVTVGYLISKKRKNKNEKPKLTKESYTGIISEVQTTESKLIQESNQKLKDNIDKLLEGNYNHVNLQKHKLNYENQVELLEKMVEVRESTKKQKGQITSGELRIKALKGQLKSAKKDLKYINKKLENKELIDSIGVENVNLDSKLSKNLTIWNTKLQAQNQLQKIKLQGGFKSVAKNFIINNFRNPLKEQIELEEEEQNLSIHR